MVQRGDREGRAGRPKSQAEPLETLIPSVLAEVGLDRASAALQLLRAWPAALGEELAAHCSAEGLRRGVVHAAVSDSAWMQRIQLEKPRILAALRAELGESEVLDLRLHIGRRR